MAQAAPRLVSSRPRLRPTKKQRNLRSGVTAHKKMTVTEVAGHKSKAAIDVRKRDLQNKADVGAYRKKREIFTESNLGAYSTRRQMDLAASRANRAAIRNEQRRASITGAPVAVAEKTASGISNLKGYQPSFNPLLLIVLIWAGVIILYVMITSADTTDSFFNSLRNWISLIYSSDPIWTTTSTPTVLPLQNLPITTTTSDNGSQTA